jgi:hypothetical protein
MKFINLLNPDPRFKTAGWIILVAVIVVYYLCYQFLTINIPFGDEYNCALRWFDHHQLLDSWWKKFIHLFDQANEHRIFTFSLAVVTDYSLFGVLNFKRLGWEANLFMVPLLFLINLLNQTNRKNPWLILPIAMLLFVPQHEITNWPIVGFGAILQSGLTIASLWFLSRSGWPSLIAAGSLAAVATFSFGNGMFTFLAGYIVIALKKPKEPLVWLTWTIIMVLSVFLYFQDYVFLQNSISFSGALRNPVPVIQFFLTYFGRILVKISQVPLYWVALAGLAPLGALGYLLVFQWKEVKKHPVSLAILFFILLSAAITSVSRQSFGVIGATAPRYILLQALFLAVLYMLYMNIYSKKAPWILPLILLSSLLFYGARLVNGIGALDRHKTELQQIILAYNTDPEEIKTFGPPPAIITAALNRSKATGVYIPPKVE